MRLVAKGIVNSRLCLLLVKSLLEHPPFKTIQCTVMMRSPSSGAVLPTWVEIGFKFISSSAILKFYYEASLMKVEFAEAKFVAGKIFIPFQSVKCEV